MRIRIAKKKPEPNEEEGEEAQAKSQRTGAEGQEEELEEMPIEDKALAVTTYNEGTSVYVINQAAARVFRQELVKEMANYIEALKVVDLSEFNDMMEMEAEKFENQFIQLFSAQSEAPNKGPSVPVFDFDPVI